MSISIKELSEKLHLSTATISRAINGSDKVTPETHRRVMEAIEKYNYVPNDAARSLKSKRFTTVAVVVPDSLNVFFMSVFAGVEAYCRDNGYSVLLCSYNEDYRQQLELTKVLLSKSIAGLIIAPGGPCTPYFPRYSEAGIPVVFIDNVPNDIDECTSVMIDNAKGARTLCRHMLNMYGDDLVLLSSEEWKIGETRKKQYSTQIRLDAAIGELRLCGLEPRDGWVLVCEKSSFEAGYQKISDFLESGARPRGIVSMSNNIAYGAIAAIQDHGLSVPGDIGVACFDAIDPTGLVRPKVTSVMQPAEQIGMLAAQTILSRIANRGKTTIQDQRIIVEPSFVVAESCGYKIRHASGRSAEGQTGRNIQAD